MAKAKDQELLRRMDVAARLGYRVDRRRGLVRLQSVESAMREYGDDRSDAEQRLEIAARMVRQMGGIECVIDKEPQLDIAGVVYFVEAPATGQIKIGFTTNIEARFKALSAHSGAELRLLATMPGTRRKERTLHRKFAADRVRGEWFRATDDLLAYIRSEKPA